MAESMQGLHRSHRCTEVNNTMIGNTVTVMGWVQKNRNKKIKLNTRYIPDFIKSGIGSQ